MQELKHSLDNYIYRVNNKSIMPSRNYTLFFIVSVGFVLICIAFITILGQTTNKEGDNSDIRAKATVTNSLRLVGFVNSVDTSLRTVVVSSVKFENKEKESADMGVWTVTLPKEVSASNVRTGKRVVISADAAQFDVATKTLTALGFNQ